MKKMNVRKEILIIMMVLLMLVTISTKVLATGTSGPITINIIAPTTETPTTDTNTTANTITNVVAPVTTNSTVSNYQNTTTLPQTGDASDYAIFLLIAVAIVIAVYAYKKVRDYNI